MDTQFQPEDQRTNVEPIPETPECWIEPDRPSFRMAIRPTGSVIKEQAMAEGFVLSWNAPRMYSVVDSYFEVAFWCFCLFGWANGEFVLLWALSYRVRGHFFGIAYPALAVDLFSLVWLFGWTGLGILIVRRIRDLVRPLQPERVILTEYSFRYDPGDKHSFARLSWRSVFTEKTNDFDRTIERWFFREKPRRVDRMSLLPFVFDEVDGRQRLTFADGAAQVEIGETLNEVEREWLYKVLEIWRAVK